MIQFVLSIRSKENGNVGVLLEPQPTETYTPKEESVAIAMQSCILFAAKEFALIVTDDNYEGFEQQQTELETRMRNRFGKG